MSVIAVESEGKMSAKSARGALGLMQIMPQTWIELSARYNLGLDPFDAHDNIVAGAAYLREMLDRFGTEGFLAAYNAGPKRFEEHLVAGRPLPDETQAYVRRLAALLEIGRNDHNSATSQIFDRSHANLFAQRGANSFGNRPSASGDQSVMGSQPADPASGSMLAPRSHGLFVPRSDALLKR
ncbi:lytic transglycosylase domain-containing protein [Bradyrhizobium sacchari]|uniref:Transglycosylase-like protein with SLT domain n=1 Tax=Bradyrhizobium sacchari TaxID=1399419 RepID=A0A560JGF9_9BRAD|nr:transglycosylase-like protein with SLT domain [Bradyrhizobium sacchari]TWB69629.1 transglycosylase-like protein with SLT domain [Bradyrhizobium sacchari]